MSGSGFLINFSRLHKNIKLNLAILAIEVRLKVTLNFSNLRLHYVFSSISASILVTCYLFARLEFLGGFSSKIDWSLARNPLALILFCQFIFHYSLSKPKTALTVEILIKFTFVIQ